MNDEALIGASPVGEDVVKWQPIETAPKDGAMFLGLWPECVQYHDQIKVSYWNKRNDRFDDVDDSGQEHPTHWMPLPDPPTPRPSQEK